MTLHKCPIKVGHYTRLYSIEYNVDSKVATCKCCNQTFPYDVEVESHFDKELAKTWKPIKNTINANVVEIKLADIKGTMNKEEIKLLITLLKLHVGVR